MRLLDTTTITLTSFLNPKPPLDGSTFAQGGRLKPPPEYAILSHVWAQNMDEEVTYGELSSGRQRDCEGWSKIIKGCEMARRDGIKWFWIDTCCIDKSSKSELDEALGSMHTYYARSTKCYVYLNDVKQMANSIGSRLLSADSPGTPTKWFSRGWTLQELLAPGTPCKRNDGKPLKDVSSTMIFFDQNWRMLGDKTDADLADEISRYSRIRPEYIKSPGGHRSASIAMKLSWAADRTTEKPEDRIYSLLGLFNLQMQVYYGEGEANAFRRLQLELIQRSDDQSIFAWIKPSDRGDPCGMLATSLDDFRDSQDIVRLDIKDKERPIYGMDMEGLKFHVFNGLRPMTHVGGRSNNRKETITLACSRTDGEEADRRNVVVIHLERAGNLMQRVSSHTWGPPEKFSVTNDTWWMNPGLRRHFVVRQDWPAGG